MVMIDILHILLRDVGDYLVLVINVIAIVVIVWWFMKTMALYVQAEETMMQHGKSFNDFHHVRQELASYLLLSLEFVIAADIIHTISNPTISNLWLLAVIVIIRTAISFVLERELKLKIKHKKKNSK